MARPILTSVRRDLGLSRLRLGLVAGGAVGTEIVRWFRMLGIDPIEIYGPAEAAGLAAAAPPAAVYPGDCGPPVAAGTLRVSATGGIEISDVSGSGTSSAGADTWRPTGDAGVMADGRLTVLGPLADTITPLSGAPVHPGPIERALCLSPYIADALVVGQGRGFLGCLLRLDVDAVENWAHVTRVPFTSFAELARTEGLANLLAGEIERVNAGVAQPNPIRAFRVIARRMQFGDPEITLLGALRRSVALATFHDLIAEIYQEAPGHARPAARASVVHEPG